MAISSLVVRTGIGAWGNIAHLITRGLDIGATPPVVNPWTPVTPDTQSWAAQSAGTDIWTPQGPLATPWTPQ